MTFKKFAKINSDRQTHSKLSICSLWSKMEWGCCIAGEVGELCNELKKSIRDNANNNTAIEKELADIVIYAFVIANNLNIDIEKVCKDKFNEVSVRIGYKKLA